jgi:hypothetical protein
MRINIKTKELGRSILASISKQRTYKSFVLIFLRALRVPSDSLGICGAETTVAAQRRLKDIAGLRRSKAAAL